MINSCVVLWWFNGVLWLTGATVMILWWSVECTRPYTVGGCRRYGSPSGWRGKAEEPPCRIPAARKGPHETVSRQGTRNAGLCGRCHLPLYYFLLSTLESYVSIQFKNRPIIHKGTSSIHFLTTHYSYTSLNIRYLQILNLLFKYYLINFFMSFLGRWRMNIYFNDELNLKCLRLIS